LTGFMLIPISYPSR